MYFIFLFLGMLWVKKCRNLSVCGGGGGRFVKYFPTMPKIWNYFFYQLHLLTKQSEVYIISFYQMVVNMGKYLPQEGKVRENN